MYSDMFLICSIIIPLGLCVCCITYNSHKIYIICKNAWNMDILYDNTTILPIASVEIHIPYIPPLAVVKQDNDTYNSHPSIK